MLNFLRSPQSIQLTRKHWCAAAVLAGLRKGVNDDQRSDHRDRGESKNILNDIQGVLGEIVSLIAVENRGNNVRVSHNPISFDQHVDDVDLTVSTGQREIYLESKCLLIKDTKSLFLVNKTAHKKSKERGASGYIPVLSVVGGQEALVGSFTTVEEVSNWDEKDFGYGDPAFSVRLSNYCPKKWNKEEKVIRQHLNQQKGKLGIVKGRLGNIAQEASCKLDEYQRCLPELSDSRSRQMIDDVVKAYRTVHE